jgi:hypothetical protein
LFRDSVEDGGRNGTGSSATAIRNAVYFLPQQYFIYRRRSFEQKSTFGDLPKMLSDAFNKTPSESILFCRVIPLLVTK